MLNRAEILLRFLISLVALILFNRSLNKKAFVGFFLKFFKNYDKPAQDKITVISKIPAVNIAK